MRRRPWLASIGLATVILLAGSAAAQADPPPLASGRSGSTGLPGTGGTNRGGTGAPPAPPDTGARPQAGGSVPAAGSPVGTLPGDSAAGSAPTGPTPAGPMGTEIMLKTSQVQTLAEQAKQLQQQIKQDKKNVAATKRNVDLATRALALFGRQTGKQAHQAYENAAKVPKPLDPMAREWRDLSKLAPWLTGSGHQSVLSYQETEKLLADARDAYQQALRTLHSDQKRFAAMTRQYHQAAADLQKLRADNSDALAALAAQQRAYNQRFAGEIGADVDGTRANPKAVQAVRFALRQVGKPYVWGAEGPDAYDCSGLVLASYLSVGVRLPRVADDQYRATSDRPVSLSHLLPGDLVFYGNTPGDSSSIYHVAMYIGHGKVVQAPTFGIPVQVVDLSVGGMYGATRVLPAVGGASSTSNPPASHPSPTHRPTPTPTRQPTPTPSPSTSGPTPTPTPSTSSPTPTPSPSTSGPTPTPSPSTSGPTPTPTPSTSGPAPTPSTTASASPSASPSKKASTSPKPKPTPSPSPSKSGPSPKPSPSTSGPTPKPSHSAKRSKPAATEPNNTCTSPSPTPSTSPSPSASPSPSPSTSPSPTPTC